MWRPHRATCLACLACLVCIASLASVLGETETMLGPRFIEEPASRVVWAARAGLRLRCAARGHPPPALRWLHHDDTPLHDLPGVRRVYDNGSLEILPSRALDPAPLTVRCRAANEHGVALSRDVTLQPASDEGWEAVVTVEPTALGGVGAVTCGAVPPTALVRAALWYRDDAVLHLDEPSPESHYIVAGDTLLIRDVTVRDAGAYSCLARHAATGVTRRARPATLTVTATLLVRAAPRLAGAANTYATTSRVVCLPCAAPSHPQPIYTWYRENEGRQQEATESGSWRWAGGAALCLPRTAATRSTWLCKARDAHGDASKRVTLHVDEPLSVTVTPAVIVADAGGAVTLTCTTTGEAGAALSWLHDGAAVGIGSELRLHEVTRAHAGVYQCRAHTPHDNAQATAELRLGASSPELQDTFIEQALRGGTVSLRCAATGSPPPLFTWLLDDVPLEQYRAPHRYAVSTARAVAGAMVSMLNISAATSTDGGRYSCRAENRLGSVTHTARLNIYGPPSIRSTGPVRVVAGANATVYCPYAGYPIRWVRWARRGGAARAAGAALRLAPAAPADAGHYTCTVEAPPAPPATRDFEIQVRNPPKISPFIFSSELSEGSAAQVLCGVSSGDKPLFFSWLKDGAPLPADLQVEEKSLNEFSLLMFSELSARHAGAYTCRVANHAATVNYTATLNVKVAPAWLHEPHGAAVLVGAPLRLPCSAAGHPTPTLFWQRRIGKPPDVTVHVFIPSFVSSLTSENTFTLLFTRMDGESGTEGESWERVAGGWGGAMHSSDGTLSVVSATRALHGLYRCVADNGVGPPLVKHVNVTVHEAARVESGGNVSAVAGGGAALACEAHGDAPLSVHWWRDGERLDLASFRWSVSEVRLGDALRSTLSVRATSRGDAGAYRCRAHNAHGASEQTLHLSVEEAPGAPHALQLGGLGARWVRVAWRAPPHAARYVAHCTPLHAVSEPRALNLTLDEPGRSIDIGAGTGGERVDSAKVDGLQPAVAYSLRVVATNRVGPSPPSEPLLFTTLEEAPTAAPQDLRVRASGPEELHVAWLPPRQDECNGELLGYVVSWREVGAAHGDAHSGSVTARGGGAAELALDEMRPSTRYAVTVRALNRAGAGPPSPLVYTTTQDAAPDSAPGAVACEGESPRSVRVHWSPLPTMSALRGYDIHYAPLDFLTSGFASAGVQTARAAPGGAATLRGLRAATNYSVWVSARSDAGVGPPSPPASCSTGEDVPEVVEAVRAIAAGEDTVRVTWLAPPGERILHYTLYSRELGKLGGEWATRVDAVPSRVLGVPEMRRDIAGLRARTLYEFRVNAVNSVGPGPSSRPVTAAPAPSTPARITSFSRTVHAAAGGRARLPCGALGTPPLRRRWTPSPPGHSLSEDGDLIIHGVRETMSGNYTCTVQGAGGVGDVVRMRLAVVAPPDTPAPRLVRAERHALLVAWDQPHHNGAPITGYTVWWWREASDSNGADGNLRVASSTRGGVVGGAGGSALVPGSAGARRLHALECGARYAVALQAHNALGPSSRSPPLYVATLGDKATPATGEQFVWANSSTLRLNLLTWRARCPVTSWRVSLRPAPPAPPAPWTDLPTDGETAEAPSLAPGAWYEVRVEARSGALLAAALYRASTRALSGDRIGSAVLMREAATGAAAGGEGMAGRASLAPTLLAAAGLSVLLAVLAGVSIARRRRAASCVRRGRSPADGCEPHPQLYTTEPGKKNGKMASPPDGRRSPPEISPYATFSMAGGVRGGARSAGAGGGCALHLHTFAGAEVLDLAAPPPRPNLLAHHTEYGRESDSESSGSPCAACAAELYRAPLATPSDMPRTIESSAEDTVYGGSAAGSGRARRRRDTARPPRRHAPPALRLRRAEPLAL